MEKLTLERQNNKYYLVGRVPEGSVVDEDCLATISQAKAGEERENFMGVVPVIYSQIFQERTLKYDINAYLPLAEYKSQITGREQLGNFFLSIIDTYQKAESYLLDTGFFLLDEEYVYVNETTGKACLIMYPVVGAASEKDLRQLFRRIMKGIHLVEKDMGFYGKVIYELDYAESFNIVKFRELLSSKGADNEPAASFDNSNAGGDTSQGGPVRSETGKSLAQPGQLPTRPGQILGQPGKSSIQSGQSVPGEQDDFPNFCDSKLEKAVKEKKREGGLSGLFGGVGRKNKSSKAKISEENTTKERSAKEKSIKEESGKERQVKDKSGRRKAISGRSNIFALPDEEVGVSPQAPKFKTVKPDSGNEEPFGVEIPKTADEDIFASYARTIDEDDETGDAACKKALELFYRNEKRIIQVTVFPFEIGREGSGYRIDPSKGKVSRRHVVLQRDGERFQICDVSKLGTMLNGQKLPKDTCVDLADGMRIDMKGEIFEVRIIEE